MEGCDHMKLSLALLALATLLVSSNEKEDLSMKKLTPILTVKTIEPSLEFWVERLGFQVTMKVPEEGPLAFAGVERNGVEIMFQTLESIDADMPELKAGESSWTSALFLEVADLDAVAAKLRPEEIVKARHTTFYGMMEVVAREPGGHLVTFAQPVKAEK